MLLEMSMFLIPLGPLGIIFHDGISVHFRLCSFSGTSTKGMRKGERGRKIKYKWYPIKFLSAFFSNSFIFFLNLKMVSFEMYKFI